MAAYFLRRFLLIIPTFLGITLVVFVITRIVPGGPIEKMINQAQMMEGSRMASPAGGTGGSSLSEAQMEQLKRYYGFDKPHIVAYFHWLGKVLSLDLGNSTRYGEPVLETIIDKLPVSLYYGLITLVLTYLVCIPLGVVKAIKHATWIDSVSSVLVFIGYAIPGYVFGIFLLVTFASNLEWFPLGGFVSEDFSDLSLLGKVGDLLYHSTLPLIAYLIGSFAFMTLLMKNSLMENLAADYVRTAIAKGVPFRRAVFAHAFRNSLIPMATHFGNNISIILTGSFLIEKIFNIDGMGLLGIESIIERDYPVVLGVLVVSSLLYLVGNILSDICVALVDPRVKFE